MAGIDYPRLMGRLMGRPLMATPEHIATVLNVLAPRAGLHGTLVDTVTGGVRALGEAGAWRAWSGDEEDRRRRRTYDTVRGVAVIPVQGTLVSKNGLDPYCGMTGYDGLMVKLREAADDDDVLGVALDIESPGGEVHSQLYELTELIADVSAVKPVHAILSDYACSAAYHIASPCTRITAPHCGEAGSIGCFYLHWEESQRLADEGVVINLIRAGERKARINSLEPLPDEERAWLQAGVEEVYEAFCQTVANGRRLSVEAVKATESRSLNAQEALAAGLVDAVITPSEALDALIDEVHAGGGTTGYVGPGARAALAGLTRGAGAHHTAAAPSRAAGVIIPTLPARGAAASAGSITSQQREGQMPPTTTTETTTTTAAGAVPPTTAPAPTGAEAATQAAASAPTTTAPAPAAAAASAGADAAALAAAKAEGAAQERARIAGILRGAAAKGREGAAMSFAFDTDMAADAASKILATLPKSGGLAATVPPNPDVGSAADGGQAGKLAGLAAAVDMVSGAAKTGPVA